MIGLFDSGSGGLTVLRAIRERAPRADIAYFGDIANAPYGPRSEQELRALTASGLAALRRMGAAEMVSACNSVSTSVLAGAAGEMPVIEMTRPTARAMRAHAGSRALLLATEATVRSGIYEDALGVSVVLDQLAVPALAAAVEFGESEASVRQIVRRALAQRRGKSYEYIILGCTHYPLARDSINSEAENLFGTVRIIDPAEAVADEVVKRFSIEGSGQVRCAISAPSALFRARLEQLFPGAIPELTVVAPPLGDVSARV